MKSFILLSLLLSPVFAHAELIMDRVAKVLPGKTLSSESLILLAKTGRVLRSTNTKAIQELSEVSLNNNNVSFIEENDQILSYVQESTSENNPVLDQFYDRSLPSFSVSTLPTSSRYSDANYIPTNFQSVNDVQKLMDQLKINEKSKSECYQRAHLWAIEMVQMANIQSEKVFLFFSEKYMREYNFHWWFHVAPLVLINNQERVVDPSFFDQPADMQTWVNFFMHSHPTCKTVSNYSDYDNHQEEEYCFLRKLPMYYFEPTEVEARDEKGEVISDWIEGQVSQAYGTLLPWWKR